MFQFVKASGGLRVRRLGCCLALPRQCSVRPCWDCLPTSSDRLQEDDARWFFQQLIVGLDYCHKMVCSAYKNSACPRKRQCAQACVVWFVAPAVA